MCQILAFYLIWFDLETLSKLTKDIKQKKSLKIAKSMSNHHKSHLKNTKCLDLYQRVPTSKNQLSRATTVANMYLFAVIKDYAAKPEVDF